MVNLEDPARFLRDRRVRAEHAGQNAAKRGEPPKKKMLHWPFAFLFLSLSTRILCGVGVVDQQGKRNNHRSIA
jgi:hypothetical protein